MKNCMCFVRGIGVGIVAGMSIAIAIKSLCANNKSICKRKDKAAKAMGEIMNDIKEMLS